MKKSPGTIAALKSRSSKKKDNNREVNSVETSVLSYDLDISLRGGTAVEDVGTVPASLLKAPKRGLVTTQRAAL